MFFNIKCILILIMLIRYGKGLNIEYNVWCIIVRVKIRIFYEVFKVLEKYRYKIGFVYICLYLVRIS